MRVFKTILLLAFCCGFGFFQKPISAGNGILLSNLQTKPLVFTTDTLKLDSLSILPGSFNIVFQNEIIDTSFYHIDYVKSELFWKENPGLSEGDTLQVTYRTFPIAFDRAYFNKDISLIEQEDILMNPFRYEPAAAMGGGALDLGNLNYAGSISRGLSFGNKQDVILNSSLNLQLSGMITDDVEIIAAITDNNIPIQPEGNTQQLQEFDRVFIQLKSRNHRLIAGDYDLNKDPNFFMAFRKRLQGASYEGRWDLMNEQQLTTGLSFAVAKGKFARNRLNVSDGNQGPYRLQGNNGETFLIILAGSERVFIDEQLMTRGADRDYVIDYNLGEITFTPNRMITKDSRVVVEFEYSDKNYFRSMVHAKAEYEINPDLVIDFHFFNEQDNRNQPVVQQLSPEQREFLEEAGDKVEQLLFPGIRESEFDIDRIMYKKVDTVIGPVQYDSVFVYSTNSDSAEYLLTFAFVGQGNGNYVPAQTTANGRVYQWVAPQNGIPSGRYEPVIVLIPPQQQQMATLGINWTPDDRTRMRTEIAYSNFDRNTFSDLDGGDNEGMAAKTAWKRTFLPFNNEKLYLDAQIDYEFANRNFNPIERYRPVAFDRDWNYTFADSSRDEHILNTGFEFGHREKGYIKYRFSTMQIDEIFSGFENAVRANYRTENFEINPEVRYMEAEILDNKNLFFRPSINLSRKIPITKGWRVGGAASLDNNEIRDANDTLSLASFRFYKWLAYISSPDTTDVQTRVTFTERTDYLPDGEDFTFESIGRDINWEGDAFYLRNHNLRWNLTYRWVERQDSLEQFLDPEHFYLGRLEYSFGFLRGVFRTNLLYEVGSGREQRREFTYVEVPDGKGNYMWTDYNDNGIKELDEFELAPPGFEDQAVYIRVFTPTNEFDDVNTTLFNASQSIDPAAVWATEDGIKKLISRLSTQSTMQISRKVFANIAQQPFNPFNLSVDDLALVSINSSLRNTFFLNRSGRIFNADYTFADNRSRSILVNGFELRLLQEHVVQNRINLNRNLQIGLRYTNQYNTSESEVFADRMYRIRGNEIQPRVTYMVSNNLRFNVFYTFSHKLNDEEGGEIAIQHNGKIEGRLSRTARSSVNSTFSYSRVEFDHSFNTPVAFAMLQGLQPGNNFQWSVSYNQNIANNVQISLSYEGRKTGDADMVHVGRAQMRALF